MILTDEQRAQLFNPEAMEEYFTSKENENKSSLTTIYTLLNASKKIEKAVGKNFYEMTPEEYEKYFLLLDDVMISKVRFQATFINDYNLWAYRTGRASNCFQIAKVINFRTLDYSDIIKRQIIKSEEEFKTYLNGNIEAPTITNEDMCPLLCWIGISPGDMASIREVDVLTEVNKIIYKDKYLSMPQSFMNIIKAYMDNDYIDTAAGKRYKNKSKYLLKYTIRTEGKLAEYKDKKYGQANITWGIRSFLTQINDRYKKAYSLDTLILSRDYWDIYKKTKSNPSDEAINAYITDIIQNNKPTRLKDYKAGYDQYVKTYWEKKQ